MAIEVLFSHLHVSPFIYIVPSVRWFNTITTSVMLQHYDISFSSFWHAFHKFTCPHLGNLFIIFINSNRFILYNSKSIGLYFMCENFIIFFPPQNQLRINSPPILLKNLLDITILDNSMHFLNGKIDFYVFNKFDSWKVNRH